MRYAIAVRLATVTLAAVSLAACLPPTSDPVVDGWPIGSPLACDPTEKCPELLATARDGLDRRDPGHAPITRTTLHAEGTIVDASGRITIVTRSGACCYVARFELADGTVSAIGVGYPGISTTPRAVDYGP